MKSLWIVSVAVIMIFTAILRMDAGAAPDANHQARNAAFRDGTYLGNLAASRSESPRIASGRWSRAEDRASFTYGYQQAYEKFSADRGPWNQSAPEASVVP